MGSELISHHLIVGGREVTLLEGPAGWGELSLVAGYPCSPEAARRAAEEAATVGFPAPVRRAVMVNALVAGLPIDAFALAGYPAIKIKIKSLADVDLVAQVRDLVGPGPALRVDANGAFSVETAQAVAEQLAFLGVELFEQPVASLEDLATVRRSSPIPIAADEAVRTVADAQRLRALGAADVLVLKVAPLGGVRAALEIAEVAGVPALVSSMMETSVGVSAGLALAAALPELAYPCGLATVAALPEDVVARRLLPEHGVLRLRNIVPDADLLERYSAAANQAAIS